MLVYNIASKKSAEDIMPYHAFIRRIRGPNISCIVIGNMLDKEDEREVSEAEGRAMADSLDCSFYEVSAKSGIGVNDAFVSIAQNICLAKSEALRQAALEDAQLEKQTALARKDVNGGVTRRLVRKVFCRG